MIIRQYLKILMFIPLLGILLVPPNVLLNNCQIEEEKVKIEKKLAMGVVWNQTLIAGETEYGISAIERQDGNIIISSLNYKPQLRLWCLTPNGDLIWNSSQQVPDILIPSTIVECDDGGFLVAGTLGTTYNAYAIRFDRDNVMLWYFISFQTNRQIILDACELIAGHFLLVGTTWNTFIGDKDALLIHLDDSGSILWNVTYGSSQYDEWFDAVAATNKGDAIAIGTVQDRTFSQPSEMIGVRIDINGSLIWQRNYSWGLPSEGTCITDSEGGRFLIVGSIWEVHSRTGVILIDEFGQPLWNQTYTILQYPQDITRTLGGTFVIVGQNNSVDFGQAVCFCINSTGVVRWEAQPGPLNSLYVSITPCDNGDFLLVGTLMGETWVLRSREDWAPSAPILLPPQVLHLMSIVVLCWLPGLDTDEVIASYRIQMASSDNFTFHLMRWQVEGVSLALTNVSDGTHWFRICAVDDLNVASIWSNLVNIRVSRESILLLINIVLSSIIAISVGTGTLWYLSKRYRNIRRKPQRKLLELNLR